MNDVTKNNLKTVYAATPPRVKELIESGSFEQTLGAILENNKVSEGLRPAVENAVLLTVLGVTEIEEMIHDLHDIDGLTDTQISGVVDSVAEKIFVPLIEKAQALAGTSGLPKEEISHEETATGTSVPPDHRLPEHGIETKTEEKAPPPPRPQGVDPYREPIE